MYLSKATDDDIFLFMAADIFDAIESCCKTSCGYTSVRIIRLHIKSYSMNTFV